MKTYKERTKDILNKVQREKAKRARRIKVTSVLATGFSLLLALNLVLFIPYDTSPPSLSTYKDSEYYSLMQTINELTYTKPRYKNNFDAWFSDFFKGYGSGNADNDAPESPGDAGDAGTDTPYSEVTDNQVAGVIEGDLFKRTDSHIFYLTSPGGLEMRINAYTIAKGESAACGIVTLSADENTYFRYSQGYDAEMYLSADGDTATVFTPVWSYEHNLLYTAAISVDVSDPENMEEIGRTYVSGSYVTSRKVGDDFLLISNFSVRRDPDFSDEAQFLPQAGAIDDLKSLPMQDIVCPDGADAARYTVICRLGENLSVEGHIAFLSFSEEAYVSEGNIFVTRSYFGHGSACSEDLSYSFTEDRTQISCVSYEGEGLTLAGTFDVAGSVRNQYSMDEKDGTLRVATTLSRSVYDSSGYIPHDKSGFNAGLYIVSLSDFQIKGKLEWFAPADEKVMSVRFDGDIAWVCTAIEWEPNLVEDPVFRIDLSDPKNITYTDTGTIPGYSFSLVDFTDGTLLGIGYGDATTLKIEIYEQGDGAVLPLTSFERLADFSEQYKAYFIDRENGLVGLHLYDWQEGSMYILLHFDGYTLAPVLSLPLENNDCDTTRATVIDGWLYVLTSDGFDFLAQPLPGLAE